MIVNFHSGNWIIKPTVRQLNRDLEKIRVFFLPVEVGMRRNHEVLDHVMHGISEKPSIAKGESIHAACRME